MVACSHIQQHHEPCKNIESRTKRMALPLRLWIIFSRVVRRYVQQGETCDVKGLGPVVPDESCYCCSLVSVKASRGQVALFQGVYVLQSHHISPIPTSVFYEFRYGIPTSEVQYYYRCGSVSVSITCSRTPTHFFFFFF